jgi:hypothetical protein
MEELKYQLRQLTRREGLLRNLCSPCALQMVKLTSAGHSPNVVLDLATILGTVF